MKRVLVINNYDSFVYNLIQLLRESGLCTYKVVRNDAVTPMLLAQSNYILLSPGPGLPQTTPQLTEVIARCCNSHSILGVCLGHQALAAHFGIPLIQVRQPKHGHLSILQNIASDSQLFRSISEPLQVGRYHSWTIDPRSIADCTSLQVTASDEEGNVMAIEHVSLPLFGVQFHPESLLCNCGMRLIKNWLTTSG